VAANLPAKPFENVFPPLVEVDDPRRHPVGRKREAQRIDRWFEQPLGHAGGEQAEPVISCDDIPRPINDQGRPGRGLIEQLYTPGAGYIDPHVELSGRNEIDEFVGAVQSNFPGYVFSLGGPVDSHHDQARSVAGPDLGQHQRPAGLLAQQLGHQLVETLALILDSAGSGGVRHGPRRPAAVRGVRR